MNLEPVAVYIHTPFCPSKCGYCDFNSYAMQGGVIGRTVDAIRREIDKSPHRGRPAKTIFFGGGTPTFLPRGNLTMLLRAITDTHPPCSDCEVTSEANPGTVNAETLAEMQEAGFNRLSIGAQSFCESDLIRLGRVHTASDIGEAVLAARTAGFMNINLDLMFALPNQSRRAWLANLRAGIELQTEHLSLYCLTIEPNTAFYKMRLRNELELPNDGAQVQMYDLALAETRAAGLMQYEISNFAKPGFECRHNLCYWRGEEYAAYGPGAVEQTGGRRWTHMKHPLRYCEAVEADESLECEREVLSDENRRNERIMLGLRLNEGLCEEVVGHTDAICRGVDRGLVRRSKGKVYLTQKGRHYCNEAVLALL